MAMRAGLLHREKALAHLHRAAAIAGAAGLGLGAGLGATATAGVAGVPGGNADLAFLAQRRFFQGDLHRVAEVAAAVDLLATATPAAATLAEDVAEDVAKGLGKATTKAFGAGAAAEAGVRVDPGMAVLVVGRALLRVGEHLVGLLGLLELLFRRLGVITLVAVRVVLHGQLAVGLLDLVLGRVLGNAEDLVVVALRHGKLSENGFHNGERRVGEPGAWFLERGGTSRRRRAPAGTSADHFFTSLNSASTTLSSSALAADSASGWPAPAAPAAAA